ncbi:ATP-binding protein [Rickettsia endosymbiont of Urophora cardui]
MSKLANPEFRLLAERYEMRSVLITSNLVFAKWNTIFKDEMTESFAMIV